MFLSKIQSSPQNLCFHHTLILVSPSWKAFKCGSVGKIEMEVNYPLRSLFVVWVSADSR
ncbi:hypothetical protein HanRHA438_Chr05g0238411 [Helianthus annuus]|nr:hypothetical protein HanHA89_Chr05g0202501 [Helianthus annuus]KAJ0920172.1 hypothetical protein HanRHA438_Chr05g0238411 [Helianthus annuus]KAJ0923834.1 hypothetical protein HanPSC8_Chr05g0221271 [Helianthus annuus]